MAQRILDDQPEDPIVHAFMLTVGRPPDAEERGCVAEFHDAQKARFTGGEADPAALQAIETAGAEATPELAAWTAVCRVLLNLDETITKA